MDDQPLTMNIRDYGKRWGIGDSTMRKIIDENPDFPVIVINKTTTKRKPRTLVLVAEADLWIKRNLRQ